MYSHCERNVRLLAGHRPFECEACFCDEAACDCLFRAATDGFAKARGKAGCSREGWNLLPQGECLVSTERYDVSWEWKEAF